MRIKNRSMLTDHGNSKGREIVVDLLEAGMSSLDPYERMRSFVKLEDNRIILDNREYEMKGDPHAGPAVYDLKDYDRVFVIGAAKGIQHAALALEDILGDVLTSGHVIAKHGEEILCRKIGVTLAGHPLPDRCCIEGCRKIEQLAEDITERDLVFMIFGSGCSSLMTYPAADITIEEISEFTRMMQIEKGIPTGDLNPVRTHIDRFKGGRISRLFKPASIIHMTTADPAKTDSPALRMTYFEMLKKNTFFPSLASGSTYEECIAILKKWDVWDQTPESIRRQLLSGTSENENMGIKEFEANGDRFFGLIFKDVTVYPAVRKRAAELGFPCIMLSEYVCAEAREAGKMDASLALNAERTGEPFRPPVILMSSGENVVTVGTEHGAGGRNQEYCLAAAMSISGSRQIVFGAVDTDGTDGPGGLKLEGAPSCLAGAVVDGDTASKARQKGYDVWKELHRHNTSELLWRTGCGVAASANVSALDLRIILISND